MTSGGELSRFWRCRWWRFGVSVRIQPCLSGWARCGGAWCGRDKGMPIRAGVSPCEVADGVVGNFLQRHPGVILKCRLCRRSLRTVLVPGVLRPPKAGRFFVPTTLHPASTCAKYGLFLLKLQAGSEVRQHVFEKPQFPRGRYAGGNIQTIAPINPIEFALPKPPTERKQRRHEHQRWCQP